MTLFELLRLPKGRTDEIEMKRTAEGSIVNPKTKLGRYQQATELVQAQEPDEICHALTDIKDQLSRSSENQAQVWENLNALSSTTSLVMKSYGYMSMVLFLQVGINDYNI